MAMEIEDDVFFADLSKQISLLIMDDEEVLEEQEFPALQIPNPSPFQGFHQYFPQVMLPPSSYEYAYEMAYANCRRGDQSKGTGVFIPRCSSALFPAKRKNNNRSSNGGNKSGTNNNNKQQQQQLDKSSAVTVAQRANSRNNKNRA